MLQRFGAVSGLIAIGLLVWSFSVFSGPTSSPEDPDSAILHGLIESGADASGATQLAMFAIPFLMVFGGFVADRFRRHGLPGWVGSTFLLGAVLSGVALMLIGRVGHPGAEGIARFIVIFGWNSATLFIPAIFAMGTMAVIATMEAGALPKALGYSAGIVALSSLTPWIGAFVLGLWIAAASLVLTIEKPATVERSTAGI